MQFQRAAEPPGAFIPLPVMMNQYGTQAQVPLSQAVVPLDAEYRLVSKSGGVEWARPLPDEAGRQAGVQGGEYEISARKRAAQALDESERRFRELLDTVPRSPNAV
ncbi:MAG TPA: hypothetical protein VKR61_08605 [Bryobacteraceae bacterium]|nr:hypothetical protein [Bryobacteraceae bacterium]